MTARNNVAVPLIFGKTKLHPTAATERAMHWLDFAGLASYADQSVSELNLHQLKYLELARALASEPRVLFLDEVLAGLNPTEIEESILMIRRIHDLGISLVIVEHVLRVVNALSTRIMALNQGLVIAEGAPEAVMKDPEVVRAYLGSRWKHA
jgi:branched-chain amino acid transport system permease protein